MLALDDEKWSLLSHAYGKADDIPKMILQLQQDFESEQANDLFYGYLCHQYSTYPSTFAAVPYIVEAAFQEHSTVKKQADIICFCGLVHASRNYDYRHGLDITDDKELAELTKTIETSYSEAINKITLLAENLLIANHLDDEDKRFVFFSFLAFRGQQNLSFMFFQFCELDEFVFSCPNCDGEIFLWAEDEKLVAYREDPVFNKETKKFELTPVEINWKSWNGDYTKEQKAKWMMFLAEKADIKPLKYQLPYLFSRMTCPDCRQSINIINSLIK